MPAPSRWTDPALTTGLAYAGLAVTGALGFLVIRSQLYVPQDASTTTANLVQHEGLARLGIALDLAVVLTQSLAALGFFRLFRRVNPVAAGAITAFGLMNALSVLIATAFSATALQVSVGPAGGGTASDALLLYQVNDTIWSAAGVFFGLWLIPMGWCALRSPTMPDLLGRILVVGGIGYVISAFARFLLPGTTAVADLLTLPATVGELWMIGLLLLQGTQRRSVGRVGLEPTTDGL